jgi:hypothetical protein
MQRLTTLLHEVMQEKMAIKRPEATPSSNFAVLVAKAYDAAPVNDPAAHGAYQALNDSNHKLFQRLLSRLEIIFCTEDAVKDGATIQAMGRTYKLIQHEDPYPTQAAMKADVEKNKKLLITIDYSNHPFFSVEDNIIFRSVHDYIVHILGNKPFGLYGELQAYNLHAKLVPPAARPAIYTEVVGQVCYQQVNGDFPVQKVAVLPGFDYLNVGKFDQQVVQKFIDSQGGASV